MQSIMTQTAKSKDLSYYTDQNPKLCLGTSSASSGQDCIARNPAIVVGWISSISSIINTAWNGSSGVMAAFKSVALVAWVRFPPIALFSSKLPVSNMFHS